MSCIIDQAYILKTIINTTKVFLTKDDLELAKKVIKEVAKVKFEKFTIQFRQLGIINFNLILKEDTFVMADFPLKNNVEDLPPGEVLYTYIEDNKFNHSNNCEFTEFSRLINNIK